MRKLKEKRKNDVKIRKPDESHFPPNGQNKQRKTTNFGSILKKMKRTTFILIILVGIYMMRKLFHHLRRISIFITPFRMIHITRRRPIKCIFLLLKLRPML